MFRLLVSSAVHQMHREQVVNFRKLLGNFSVIPLFELPHYIDFTFPKDDFVLRGDVVAVGGQKVSIFVSIHIIALPVVVYRLLSTSDLRLRSCIGALSLSDAALV